MTNTSIQVVYDGVLFTHSRADGTENSFTKSRAVVSKSQLLAHILKAEDTELFRSVKLHIRTDLLAAWAQAEEILKGSSLGDILCVVEAAVFMQDVRLTGEACGRFLLVQQAQPSEEATRLLEEGPIHVAEAVMGCKVPAVSYKRKFHLLPVCDGLSEEQRARRSRLHEVGLQAEFPVLSPQSVHTDLRLDCRLVPASTAGDILLSFSKVPGCGVLAVSHFDLGHICTTAGMQFLAAIKTCKSLELRDCVLAANEFLMVHITMTGHDYQLTSLLLHNVVGTRCGTQNFLGPILGSPHLVSVTCTGEAERFAEMAVTVMERCTSTERSSTGLQSCPPIIQVMNIQWGLQEQQRRMALPGPLHERLSACSRLTSLCIVPGACDWGGMARWLGSAKRPQNLTELRLLPSPGSASRQMGANSAEISLGLIRVIQTHYLCHRSLHKLDLRALPVIGERAVVSLSLGLFHYAAPSHDPAAHLVHLGLHLDSDDLVRGRAGVQTLGCTIAALVELTHLQLRLGGPCYVTKTSPVARKGREVAGHPPSYLTQCALSSAVQQLAKLRVLLVQTPAPECEFGFRGWRSLPTSCGDLQGGGPEQAVDAESAGGLCVLAGRTNQPCDVMRASLPMARRVSELQVWDCWESLNGLQVVAKHFVGLKSLVIGHSSGHCDAGTVPMGSAVYRAMQAPSCFRILADLPQLGDLAVVTCKCREGTLESLSALTGLQLLLLSGLALPAGGTGRTELQAVLAALGSLTKLAIRQCHEETVVHTTGGIRTRMALLEASSCFPEPLFNPTGLRPGQALPLRHVAALDLTGMAASGRRQVNGLMEVLRSLPELATIVLPHSITNDAGGAHTIAMVKELTSLKKLASLSVPSVRVACLAAKPEAEAMAALVRGAPELVDLHLSGPAENTCVRTDYLEGAEMVVQAMDDKEHGLGGSFLLRQQRRLRVANLQPPAAPGPNNGFPHLRDCPCCRWRGLWPPALNSSADWKGQGFGSLSTGRGIDE